MYKINLKYKGVCRVVLICVYSCVGCSLIKNKEICEYCWVNLTIKCFNTTILSQLDQFKLNF